MIGDVGKRDTPQGTTAFDEVVFIIAAILWLVFWCWLVSLNVRHTCPKSGSYFTDAEHIAKGVNWTPKAHPYPDGWLNNSCP